MKNVTEMKVTHVISEPGDATRYDYIVIPGEDVYRFYPYNNSFNYPTEIGIWQEENDISWLADKYQCNPHTVAECLRTRKGTLCNT